MKSGGKMTTQLQAAKDGIITNEMRSVAAYEDIDISLLVEKIKDGRVVIPYNPKHAPSLVRGVGEGLRVKVNVNLGTSPDNIDLETELKKVDLAHEFGADAVMDLSIGGDVREIRQEILKRSNLPLGTVPAYEAFELAKRRDGDFWSLTKDDFFGVIKKQAEEGVDFITVHAGLNWQSLKRLENHKRVLGIVSRGGSLTAKWMRQNRKENPLYEYYDELLDIAAEYDVTLSLGDGLRPGACTDATDRGQIEELIVLGELADRARDRGVQVMIEGPGHIPLDQVAMNMQLQKTLCRGAPFYVLGPVVCDTAPGYDHITAAIGGTVAAMNGADFLCYVTPGEHLRLPTLEDVREGIIATKIAAFSADLARGRKYAVEQNSKMDWARRKLDWNAQKELALDPRRVEEFHGSVKVDDSEVCSMCGNFCAIKISE